MNLIWRFYTDDKQRWKWQRLSVSREVITESHAAYKEYERCVADAKDNGYIFQPSQARLMPNSGNPLPASAQRPKHA